MLNQRFRIRDEIAWRKMRDGTVTIVSPLAEKIVSINQTAGIIWDLLDGNRTVAEIAATLYERFKEEGITRATIEADTCELIRSLVERQILEQIVDSPTP